MADKGLSKVLVEVDADDQIMYLIDAHTYLTDKHKKPESVLRLLSLIASGTKIATACRSTGMSYSTYVKWIHKPWYREVMELIKAQMDARLDSTVTGLIHKVTDQMEDRITNGDVILDRDGNPQRRPMSGRDLGVNFATFFDKRQLLRNKPTSVSENKSTKETLDDIAKRFEELAVADAEFEVIENDD